MTTTTPTVMILGANGRFGRSAVEAFSRAGWRVIAQSRTAPQFARPAGVVPLLCDARDSRPLIDACAPDTQVIVNALNPDYTKWKSLVPPLIDSALDVARAARALLMLPGNVYNFGRRLPARLSTLTAQVADTPKASVRIELEAKMHVAAEGGVRSVVIRAGDFIGGASPGTWLDTVIAKKLHRGSLIYPGPTDVTHAWAFLPDLAEVFVQVAARRELLDPFAVFHYAGLTLTGNELHAAFERVTGRRLRSSTMPWWLLRAAAPFAPMLAAVLEMRYLWQRPHALDETELAALIKDVPRTPVDLALQECLTLSAPGSRIQEKRQGAGISAPLARKGN